MVKNIISRNVSVPPSVCLFYILFVPLCFTLKSIIHVYTFITSYYPICHEPTYLIIVKRRIYPIKEYVFPSPYWRYLTSLHFCIFRSRRIFVDTLEVPTVPMTSSIGRSNRGHWRSWTMSVGHMRGRCTMVLPRPTDCRIQGSPQYSGGSTPIFFQTPKVQPEEDRP